MRKLWDIKQESFYEWLDNKYPYFYVVAVGIGGVAITLTAIGIAIGLWILDMATIFYSLLPTVLWLAAICFIVAKLKIHYKCTENPRCM